MEIVQDFDERSYNNNGTSCKSSRILRVKPNFFIFLSFFIIFLLFFIFSFFYFSSFSSSFFHFFISSIFHFFHCSFFHFSISHPLHMHGSHSVDDRAGVVVLSLPVRNHMSSFRNDPSSVIWLTHSEELCCAEDLRFHGTGAALGGCRFRGGGLGRRAGPLLSGWGLGVGGSSHR